MNPITYKIKTHNPILLILILLITVPSSFWLLQDFDEGIVGVISIFIFFGVLVFCNYFLGRDIEVTLTEKGVETTWAKLPFFIKYYKEVPWADIIDWNFESWNMADTFYIKTKEKKKLYIRCLNLFNRQEHLDDFIQTFQSYYYKNKHINNDINENDLPFMAKPIGRVFAFVYLLIIIFGIYIVFMKNKIPVTSPKGLYMTFLLSVLSLIIGAAIYFYFRKKKNRN